MINDSVKIDIIRFAFKPELVKEPELENLHYAKELWPIVYIITDGKIKQAYIGETTDTFSRMTAHLKNGDKNKLSEVHLITSNTFNKSATLDIESNLIKYFSGDGKYKLLNGNVGLANHNYYQKPQYWEIFRTIWDQLRSKGVAQHSLEHIDNSDLFKYSPYKSLSLDQRRSLMTIMQHLLNDTTHNIVMEGGAGTGKSIMAVFLIKLICTDNDDFNFKEFGEEEQQFLDLIIKLKVKYRNPKVALVVPMGSFRKTLQKVFKNITGLNPKMVIGPSDVFKEDYDIILVDESHRLRRRVNLGPYFKIFDEVCDYLKVDKDKTHELDWMQRTRAKCIYFYDENQSIKPSDVLQEEFTRMKQLPNTVVEQLKSQFRVNGGNGYVDYIKKLLDCSIPSTQPKYTSKDYEFVLFQNIEHFLHELKLREQENGLSRMIAGYSWEWASKNDKTAFDIEIENVKLRWNGTNIDWINTENAIEEVGCIHTTQGYDLNYAGIIFGNEITYNPETNSIEIIPENYKDKAGKNTIKDAEVLKNFILNIYKTILLRGIKGTYVYACDPNLRTYLAQHIATYESAVPNYHFTESEEIKPYENAIPLYDLEAAAGGFSDEQQPKVLEWIKLPSHYSPSEELFACTVVGESMNKIIPNGSIALFRKYQFGSRNGKIVLVQSADIQDPESGASYTVKEYESKKMIGEDTWQHEYILLKPKSFDNSFEPIVLQKDTITDFKVIGVFEGVID
ncbi:DNA/RNA helicase domain-containing protein [Flavobacterium sp.]|uniref:DNA/RNA helicase domain-containing protein n=1 Tax=Flavobacterium sp. TaxID=239 RepID=UPI0025F55A93|nr:DNA/RNA helicase domain-containing protein [Flavobacterium sp.]